MNAQAPSLGAVEGDGHGVRPPLPSSGAGKRNLMWLMFLGITPICLGVVVWAALGLNGNYPTVAPPVPRGWQAVPGIYASFSVPANWSLQQSMSDSAGDIYYSGPGGSAGESVVEADRAPARGNTPPIVRAYLVEPYISETSAPVHLQHAEVAWSYTFELSEGRRAWGIEAWVQSTRSQIWLVSEAATPTAAKVLSTLTLAS